MKKLTRVYFYAFPILLLPFMFLLYTGNVFLYNIYAFMILLILIVNRQILYKKKDDEISLVDRQDFSTFKRIFIANTVIFAISYISLFVWFLVTEFLAGIGSV
jgi:hypothetical protein